jgi:hypothetical protein
VSAEARDSCQMRGIFGHKLERGTAGSDFEGIMSTKVAQEGREIRHSGRKVASAPTVR